MARATRISLIHNKNEEASPEEFKAYNPDSVNIIKTMP